MCWTQMLQLIALRGEVPRYVLLEANSIDMDTSLETAVGELTWLDIEAAGPQSPRGSHRICKIHPPEWEAGGQSPSCKVCTCNGANILPGCREHAGNNKNPVLQVTSSTSS